MRGELAWTSTVRVKYTNVPRDSFAIAIVAQQQLNRDKEVIVETSMIQIPCKTRRGDVDWKKASFSWSFIDGDHVESVDEARLFSLPRLQ